MKIIFNVVEHKSNRNFDNYAFHGLVGRINQALWILQSSAGLEATDFILEVKVVFRSTAAAVWFEILWRRDSKATSGWWPHHSRKVSSSRCC